MEFLKSCLESIFAQDYENYEVVIVDNESTDGSFEYIQALNNPHIKLFKSNLGTVGDLRNFAISKATGDYFITLDSDDKICDGLLTKLSEEISISNADLIKFNAIVEQETKITDNQIFVSEIDGNFGGKELLSRLCNEFLDFGKIFGPSWLYAVKIENFRKNKLKYLPLLQEDLALAPLLLLNSNLVRAINFNGYIYNIHSNSITTNKMNTIKKAYAVLRICDMFYQDIVKLHSQDEEFSQLFKRYINKVLFLKSQKLIGKDREEYLSQLLLREYYEE